MITTILNSRVSLVGLAVSDLLNNLITIIVRRTRLDPKDALLPPLVQCISSLGTHVYYADQINDIVEELAMRIADLPQNDARSETVRILILCITGVMTSADEADEAEARLTSPTLDKGKAPQTETATSGRRNPITPMIWQETLPLLCEETYAVRIAYTRALILFLENELARDKPFEITILRFCNALHAALYTLAMSSNLGIDPELGSGHLTPKLDTKSDAERGSTSEKAVAFDLTGSSTPPKSNSRSSRRVSLPLNRMNSFVPLKSFDNVATPYDFASLLTILDKLHTAVPVAAMITGIPMLLALDRDAGTDAVSHGERHPF